MTAPREHSPLPWYSADVNGYGLCIRTKSATYRRASDGKEQDAYIATRVRSKEDAALIVRAVNAHEELCAALEGVLDDLGIMPDDDRPCAIRARAAIAKAKGVTP